MVPANEMMTAAQLVNQLEEMCQNSAPGMSLQSPADIKKVGKKLFVCEKCGRSYSHRRNLWRHKKHECGKEPQFQCPYCPKRSKLKSNMKQHIFIHESHLYRL